MADYQHDPVSRGDHELGSDARFPSRAAHLSIGEISKVVTVLSNPSPEFSTRQVLATAIVMRAAALVRGSALGIDCYICPSSPRFQNFGFPFSDEDSRESAISQRFSKHVGEKDAKDTLSAQSQRIFLVGVENMFVTRRGEIDSLTLLFLRERKRGNAIVGGLAAGAEAFTLKEAAELVGVAPAESVFFGETSSLPSLLTSLQESVLEGDPVLVGLIEKYHLAYTNPDSPQLADIQKVLEVIGVSASIMAMRHPEDRVDMTASLRELVLMLSAGEKSSTILAELTDRFDFARHEAMRYLSTAEMIKPGIYSLPYPVIGQKQLVGDAIIQVNSLVHRIINKRINTSEEMKVVFFWSPDYMPTSLTREEGDELEQRLKAGEDPDIVGKRLTRLLADHKDSGRLMQFNVHDMRGSNIKPYIQEEIERSRYVVDPEGSYYLAKAPKEIDRDSVFNVASADLSSFDCLWVIDPSNGKATRAGYIFQAKHLDAVVRAFARYV